MKPMYAALGAAVIIGSVYAQEDVQQKVAPDQNTITEPVPVEADDVSELTFEYPTNIWLSFQPAVNAVNSTPFLRLQGGVDLTDRISTNFLLDLYGTNESQADMESFYLQEQVALRIAEPGNLGSLDLMAELDAGTDYDDTLRFGFGLTKELWKGNSTTFMLYPVDTEGYGVQAGVFMEQSLGQRLKFDLNADFDLELDSFYFEPKLIFDISEFTGVNNMSLYIESQHYGEIEDVDKMLEKYMDIDNHVILFGLQFDF